MSNLINLGLLAANPLGVFSSKVSAYSKEEYYGVCQDDEYNDLGVAVDPFCNPVLGMSENLLSVDPDTVIEQMYGGHHIDNDGAPIGKYADFV